MGRPGTDGAYATKVGEILGGRTGVDQIGQELNLGNGVSATLTGGARAENVFWQVAGQTTLGTTADFSGILLCQTLLEMNTGAPMHGRAYAQTAVTLDATPVTQP